MTHFGLICPELIGHLNPMLSLGKELQQRGHRVTLFGALNARAKTLAAGLEFILIGEAYSTEKEMAEAIAKARTLRGREARKHGVNNVANFLQKAPKVIKKAGVEALLVDQVSLEGGSVAEFLDIPFITIGIALPLNFEDSVPPCFTNWNYNPRLWGRLRNRLGYHFWKQQWKPWTEVINEYRQKWKLPTHHSFDDTYSQLAQISQQIAELEFPRKKLPKCFHFKGSYSSPVGRLITNFPYDKLTGQPLIYASLGTVQDQITTIGIFQQIAEACAGLDAQLVMSLGRSTKPESLPELAGSPLVVEYAPQLELLQKAALTITHGGLNTTLESLSNGVPMVVIPTFGDQPGIAARMVWAGCGEAVLVKKLNVSRLRSAIEKVLTRDFYKQNAVRLQEANSRSGGVSRAIDIVEEAISTGKPVLS